jgi:hypothetical protein
VIVDDKMTIVRVRRAAASGFTAETDSLAERESDFSAIATLHRPLKNPSNFRPCLRFHVAVLRRPLLLSSVHLWEQPIEGWMDDAAGGSDGT